MLVTVRGSGLVSQSLHSNIYDHIQTVLVHIHCHPLAQATVTASLGHGSSCLTAPPGPAQRPPSRQWPGSPQNVNRGLCCPCPTAFGALSRLEGRAVSSPSPQALRQLARPPRTALGLGTLAALGPLNPAPRTAADVPTQAGVGPGPGSPAVTALPYPAPGRP